MVQCEMCGTETATPKTVKVEGAELQVCDQCAEFGTEVTTQESASTSTKYSTSSESGSGSGSGTGTNATSNAGGASRSRAGGGSDMFDDVEELAQDYDDRIRRAREQRGLSQAELADQLNEKASLIRKLERAETLPSDDVQRELERFLDIDLSASTDVEDSEWEADASTGEYTLGDVVERKD